MAHFEMPVDDYMTAPVHVLRLGETLVAANDVFVAHGVSAIGVVDDAGALKGVVSRTDLLHAAVYEAGQAFRVPGRPVEEIMQSPAVEVSRGTPLSVAAKAMVKERVHRVFVTADGAVQGVVSTRDLMRAVAEKRIKTPIAEIASGSIVKVKAEDPIALAVDRLDVSNKHGLVVVESTFPVGIFDQAGALESRRLPPETPVEHGMNARILILPSGLGLGRAAEQALAMNARRILIEDERGVTGIVGGLDFARVMHR
ncbi:MAG: CBS domain-containing protein [Myxococcota bacterium]